MHVVSRIATLSGNLTRLNIALTSLETRDPHAALGVTGRRLQLEIEATRSEIARLRDVRVAARMVEVFA